MNGALHVRKLVYEDAAIGVYCDYLHDIQKAALHLKLNPGVWSVRQYKVMRGILAENIIPLLIKQGYSEVYATPFENDIKAQKLIKMFGFTEYGRNMGLVLMKREF